MPSSAPFPRQLRVRFGVIAAVITAMFAPARGQGAQTADPIDELLSRMTLEEKISMLYGAADPQSVGQYGYLPGVPRLGIPALRISDGAAGLRTSQPATALPAPIALAATFSPDLARTYGQTLARDARALRQHVILAPTANVTRALPSERHFETLGEDPFLASRLVSAEVESIQRLGVIAAVKNFVADADERAMREVELPAFEAALRAGAGAVVTPSNQATLLTDLLRGEWKFPGFLIADSDTTRAAASAFTAGIDMELPRGRSYTSLADAVKSGQLAETLVNRSVRRILLSMNGAGLFNPAIANRESPPIPRTTPAARDIAIAGAVLLKNSRNALPLGKGVEDTVAMIGATAGTPLGAAAGTGVQPMRTDRPVDALHKWAPLLPLNYVAGDDVDAAVRAAKSARTAVVFAHEEAAAGRDRASLSLPAKQDALIRAVAAANSRTVVVLQTGGPILMPWAGDVAAILQMWYPGQEGADAIASMLIGDASPGGKLPVTFALFPFGHGLSYSEFEYSGFAVTPAGDGFDATFTVRNKGTREASDVPQLYLGPPSPAPVPMANRSLVGFQRVVLPPGRTQQVTIHIGARELSYWSVASHGWVIAAGSRMLQLGASSRDIKQEQKITVVAK